MYPGEVDGFTWFPGGEAEAGQRGDERFTPAMGEIPTRLWQRDGTKLGTSQQHRGSFSLVFPPRSFIWGEFNLVPNQQHCRV